MKPLRFVLRTGGPPVTVVRRGSDRVEIDGRLFATREAGPGSWQVSREGRTSLVHVARDDDGWWVHAAGHAYRLEIESANPRPRRRPAASEESLTAPMPATVRAVLADVGQTVRRGDTILMLEAMKMELPIRAPREATVTAITCREGEIVQPGVPLVELS